MKKVVSFFILSVILALLCPLATGRLSFLSGFNKPEHPALTGLPCQSSLLGFWPFDKQSSTIDVKNNRWPYSGYGSVNCLYAGPSGVIGSSFFLLDINDKNHVGPVNGASFTATFYYYPYSAELATNDAAIFSFPVHSSKRYQYNTSSWYNASYKINTTRATAQIYYNAKLGAFVKSPNNFVLAWTDDAWAYHESKSIEMPIRKWTFLAVTFSSSDGVISLSDETGKKLWNSPGGTKLLPSGSSDGFYVGIFLNDNSFSFRNYLYMRPYDAIACFSLYNKTLLPEEIAQVAKACPTRNAISSFAEKVLTALPYQNGLVGFWPFDSHSGTKDLTSNQLPNLCQKDILSATGTVNFDYPGPSGINGSSHSSLYVLAKNNASPNNRTSFTVAFFYYHFPSNLKLNGSIFGSSLYSLKSYTYSTSYKKKKTILRKHYTLQFGARIVPPGDFVLSWTDNSSVYHQSRPLEMPTKTWTFFAVSFDNDNGVISIFDSAGKKNWNSPKGTNLIASEPTAGGNLITPESANNFFIGVVANGFDSWDVMLPSDSISCFTFYNKTLSSDEIAQVAQACLAQELTIRTMTATSTFSSPNTFSVNKARATSTTKPAATKISTPISSTTAKTAIITAAPKELPKPAGLFRKEAKPTLPAFVPLLISNAIERVVQQKPATRSAKIKNPNAAMMIPLKEEAIYKRVIATRLMTEGFINADDNDRDLGQIIASGVRLGKVIDLSHFAFVLILFHNVVA